MSTETERAPRVFTLKLKPEKRGDPEEIRTVTLSADIGLFHRLKKDPDEPMDLLGSESGIEKLATDKYRQAHVIYQMSDARDLSPERFFSGLSSGVIADALKALRGALLDFFLADDMPDTAQTLVTAFETMLEGRKAMARNIQNANISESIVRVLETEDVQTAINQAMETGIDEFRRTLTPGN